MYPILDSLNCNYSSSSMMDDTSETKPVRHILCVILG